MLKHQNRFRGLDRGEGALELLDVQHSNHLNIETEGIASAPRLAQDEIIDVGPSAQDRYTLPVCCASARAGKTMMEMAPKRTARRFSITASQPTGGTGRR